MSEFPIETRGLRKSFKDKQVLNGVDLKIPPGTVVGLIGTNGTGKSTLIKCLLGLLRIDAGEAEVLGEDPWDLSESAKARLGYVPQEIKLYPWMKLRQTIRYQSAWYDNWDWDLTDRLVNDFELPEKQTVGSLSQGQLQRLMIILANGHRPELLILDEPVASLDPIGRRQFLRSLLHADDEWTPTVLFSTHIMSDLERVASHVAVMQEGRISCFEELDQLKDRVKRLRIAASSDLPETFSVEGALRTEVHGRNALVAVPAVSESLVDSLKSRWDADVSVEDLNLEEIFLEMHDE
jgi:ABC-2 type transport system ATP-binding protein